MDGSRCLVSCNLSRAQTSLHEGIEEEGNQNKASSSTPSAGYELTASSICSDAVYSVQSFIYSTISVRQFASTNACCWPSSVPPTFQVVVYQPAVPGQVTNDVPMMSGGLQSLRSLRTSCLHLCRCNQTMVLPVKFLVLP